MSVDVNALRALLDKAGAHRFATPAGEWTEADVTSGTGVSIHPLDERVLIVAAVNALPDLLALAEAVRELAPLLRGLTGREGRIIPIEEMAAARRVLAILDPTNEGDGR